MCKGNNSKCTWEENDFQKNVGILKHTTFTTKGGYEKVTKRTKKADHSALKFEKLLKSTLFGN